MDAHAKPVRSLTYTVDGSRVLTASDDMNASVFDAYVRSNLRFAP